MAVCNVIPSAIEPSFVLLCTGSHALNQEQQPTRHKADISTSLTPYTMSAAQQPAFDEATQVSLGKMFRRRMALEG